MSLFISHPLEGRSLSGLSCLLHTNMVYSEMYNMGWM